MAIKLDEQKSKWFSFPEMLPTGRFKGYETRSDATQNRGAFVIGQNVAFNSAYIPTLRQGYEVIGTEAANATPVKSAWFYETRGGVQYELKTYSTFVDYWITGVSTQWLHLLTGLTANLEFGHANIGRSTDSTNLTLFCNGTDGFYKFNGSYGLYASDNAVDQITLQGSVSLVNLGFDTSGSIVINNTTITYSGVSGQTFTGCSSVPVGPAVGDLVVQAPTVVAALAGTTSSVMMAHDGRLHARLDGKADVWNYSKLDDPLDFSASAADAQGGAKAVEFSGPITAFGKLFKTVLCFKKRIIKALAFNQVGTRLDSPVYTTLVNVDDKGTTLGATNQRSTFATPSGQVFVTPDKRMVLLTGITANNEPQYLILSDPIQPIFTNGVHTDATGICVDNIIWYSFKSDINSTYNDVVLRGDMTRQSTTSDGKVIPVVWDTPYIGWNVIDWTVVYNAVTGKNEVHWHSSINSNSYRIVDSKTDNTSAFTATLRTWAESFGAPERRKKDDYIYVEIKMADNSQILCTLLYDEDGYSGQLAYVLDAATDTAYKFNSSNYNPFGASAFGEQQIGSNPTQGSLKKYRFYLETGSNVWFYNMSLQFSVTGEAQDFEVIRIGVQISEYEAEIDSAAKKNVS